MIAKQWCLLCLSVQMVLIFLFCIFWKLQLYSHLNVELFHQTPYVLVMIILVFLILHFLINYINESKLRHISNHIILTLKYNSCVFESIMQRQTSIKIPENLGVIIGKSDSNNHITLVCSPFCSHCAEAFSKFLAILDYNPDIKIQIIFTTNPNSTECRESPTNLFLTLYKKGEDMISVLFDWYIQYEMNMLSFIKKYHYGIFSEEENLEGVTEMYNFCQKTKITGTPTIYMNGSELPQLYNINDLYFILSSKKNNYEKKENS